MPVVEIRINNPAFARLESAPAVLDVAAQEALTLAGAIFQSQVRETVPVVFGVLRGSVFSELRGSLVQGYEEIVGAGGPPAPYARWIEFGGPARHVPKADLQRWALKKFRVSIRQAWAIATKVQQKIAAQGTPAQENFQRAFATRKDEIIRQVRNTIRRAVRLHMKQGQGEAAS